MFENILKWTFKIVSGDVETQINIHLDPNTPLEAVEQVAMQMIAHCTKIKEAQAAKVAAEQAAAPLEPLVGQESNAAE